MPVNWPKQVRPACPRLSLRKRSGLRFWGVPAYTPLRKWKNGCAPTSMPRLQKVVRLFGWWTQSNGALWLAEILAPIRNDQKMENSGRNKNRIYLEFDDAIKKSVKSNFHFFFARFFYGNGRYAWNVLFFRLYFKLDGHFIYFPRDGVVLTKPF